MRWGFGVSEVTTWPWSFEEDVERYRALGVDAIEVWEFKLDRDPARRREQLRRARGEGPAICSYQADVHALFPTSLRPEPRDPDARRAAILATLDELGPLIPGAVVVLNTGAADGGNLAAAFDRTVRDYRLLADRAAVLGLQLALEPLQPLAMNRDTFVWTLEDAAAIVAAVDRQALGICADAWNLAGQADLRARLARCGERIFLAQVADWRRPRSFLDRRPIGEGELDLRPFLDGLADAGYRGPLVLELFSRDVPDSLYERDLRAVIANSRDALERLH